LIGGGLEDVLDLIVEHYHGKCTICIAPSTHHGDVQDMLKVTVMVVFADFPRIESLSDKRVRRSQEYSSDTKRDTWQCFTIFAFFTN
jgi:hypothetical protein